MALLEENATAETRTQTTGYLFEELYMWHDPGSIPGNKWMQPTEFWENAETKRRFHNLLCVSGLIEKLTIIRARPALKHEILRFHTAEYHDRVMLWSRERGGDAGDIVPFAKGGYEIAILSAGGVIAAIDAVLDGKVANAYCLVRPPGHHAEADHGMGFCIFNNIAIGAMHAMHGRTSIRETEGVAVKKIAIVDYDVHHGNGTQQAFWNNPDVLFVSVHQDSNYPVNSGLKNEIGGPDAVGTTINVPLHSGSGTGAYAYTFETIVIPSLYRFNPDLILVSSGFDASFTDPLGSMMLTSEAFRGFASSLTAAAEALCDGRIVFAHEGGYSKDYVPFCGVAVIEAMSGLKSGVEDNYLEEANALGYQSLQPHQKSLIDEIASMHSLM